VLQVKDEKNLANQGPSIIRSNHFENRIIYDRAPSKEALRIAIANLGSQAGTSAPGSSCPPSHSKEFCKASTAAALTCQALRGSSILSCANE
jgi:hypothetical protein